MGGGKYGQRGCRGAAGTGRGCSSSIAVTIKASFLLEPETASDPRISARFCRLAARLVEHVCLSLAVIHTVKHSPFLGSVRSLLVLSSLPGAVCSKPQPCCRARTRRLLQFQQMNFLPIIIFFVYEMQEIVLKPENF